MTVLVSPASLLTMKRAYANLPNVNVQPLQLAYSDLTASRMIALMGNDDEAKVPLYMTSILSKVRQQGSDNFDYSTLLVDIESSKRDFNEAQRQMLALRLSLLDPFCLGYSTSVKQYSKAGHLVIVDLSDPFLGEVAACTLFDITLGLFCEADTGCKGKIIALDEAHTFLGSSSATRLLSSLLFNIRLQRHMGIRTLISTQEPTVVPAAMLDLVSFILAHRFSSPAWANHLDKHVATRNETGLGWFDEVANLQTGEACFFAPSMIGRGSRQGLVKLNRGFLKALTRARLTSNGGKSVLAV